MTNSIYRRKRQQGRDGGRARYVAVRTGSCFLAVLLSLLVFPSGARADDRDARERAAKKACLSGDYATGVSLLTDLYLDTNDANYIFNQGRCYEQGNRPEEAIISFREYLRKIRDAGKVSDGRAEQHIADCEELLRKTRVPAALLPAGGAPESPAVPPVQDPGQSKADQDLGVQASLPAASPGRGLRIAGGVTFGVGLAAIGAGVGFALAANQLADELEASPSSYERSKESTRSSYATLSTVGYAAGAVCAAGGAVLYFLGWQQGRTPSASVQPMVSSQSAGVLMQVAF